MADNVTAEVRSRIMSRIRSTGTVPELALAAALSRVRGLVRNDASLPGSPDFAFRGARLAVFLHGCFWHGCPAHYRQPKSNVRFWRAKLEGNRRRDVRVRRRLNRIGWSVMLVWEHDVRDEVGSVAERIRRRLAN